jgi:predicted RND superfamily exporter protein
VGEPILTSSLCLSLGFCALLTAERGGLAAFGRLAAVGVTLGDLLLLPAALLVSLRATSDRSPTPGQWSVVVESQ